MDIEQTYTNQFIKAGKFDESAMFIKDNLIYETITGSTSYATNTPTSDLDICSIFMDRHQDLFPQQHGIILGFNEPSRFEAKEQKGDKKIVLGNGKDCEGEFHSLTNFFTLVGLKGSPNLLEVIFTRSNFVTFGSPIAFLLRDNRRLFLSQKTYISFRGYAYGQMSRIRNHHKTGKSDNPKRQNLMERFGYDTKQAGHLLRLLDQMEQVLTTNDLDLQQNHKQVIACRNGEFGSFEFLEEFFNKKSLALEELALKTSLPSKPQLGALQTLLASCIEEFYGSDSNAKKQTEYVSVKALWDRLDIMEKSIDKIASKQV